MLISNKDIKCYFCRRTKGLFYWHKPYNSFVHMGPCECLGFYHDTLLEQKAINRMKGFVIIQIGDR